MSCYITVIKRLMSNIRHLITVIWCQTSKVRHLIWDICCHNFYQTSDVRRNQTSDNSYMTADVLCQMSNITRLLSYNCYQTSDVWFDMLCYITVIRRLITYIPVIRRVITVIWCQTSDNSYMSADIWDQTNNIRRLITVIWQHTSDIRCLLSYNCYQTSDVIYLTIIRRRRS